jgi:ribonucleoside-triphosphate reductase
MMAPGVVKSFKENLISTLDSHHEYSCGFDGIEEVRRYVEDLNDLEVRSLSEIDDLLIKSRVVNNLQPSDLDPHYVVHRAMEKTKSETLQAMESFIHNMNSMHSRGGNQVVFSSINYGTDTSVAGRIVIDSVLEATKKGLGKGEIPIFPIQIYKCKDGVSYSKSRLDEWIKCCEKGQSNLFEWRDSDYACNLDLMIKACEVSSYRLFPNFLNLDATYNHNDLWDRNDPERWKYEVATMGCRTRVFDNVNGGKTSVGRGNLSFTTINLVRIAIESDSLESFYSRVRSTARKVADQLYDRYQYQRTALARQFGFMVQNGMWSGSEKLRNFDEVGDVLDSGTLGIGFIGGHNAMYRLFGESIATSHSARRVLMNVLDILNEVADEYKSKYKLNYSVLATPAEGLSGRFTAIDREKFGIIDGVTDRDYYINSFHIDVKEPISIIDKITIESAFHEKCLGGAITYVELDGSLKGNAPAAARVILHMMGTNGGYFSMNYPSDTCKSCGFTGVIGNYCPKCESESISRVRRITGYLVGDMNSWNSYKVSEERDRVKHRLR